MSGKSVKLRKLHILANFEAKVQHLSASRQAQHSSLVDEFTDLFLNVHVLKQTTLTLHYVEDGDTCPIKQYHTVLIH